MSGPVVVNARAAVRSEVSGVERWAREMVARLPELRVGGYAIAEPPPGFAHKAGQLWEQAVLPARAAAKRARTVFSPANLAPLLWPRNVVVIHDAVVLSHPEWFSPAYVAWHSRMTRANAKRALRVVVPSQFSAGELTQLAGVPPERLVVIPGGVDERFAPDVDPEPAARALELHKPYVLTVGGLGERKNLRALDPLAPALAERGIELVAVGVRRTHHSHSDDLRGVRALGYVPEELLPSLYAGARAFVLPSLHEGFGLTCIEAMRSGVPVAASNRGALPEACGGAALHFDPADAAATEAAVLRVVDDQDERTRLRAAGLARASELTWDRAARAVDALLFADP